MVPGVQQGSTNVSTQSAVLKILAVKNKSCALLLPAPLKLSDHRQFLVSALMIKYPNAEVLSKGW